MLVDHSHHPHQNHYYQRLSLCAVRDKAHTASTLLFSLESAQNDLELANRMIRQRQPLMSYTSWTCYTVTGYISNRIVALLLPLILLVSLLIFWFLRLELRSAANLTLFPNNNGCNCY